MTKNKNAPSNYAGRLNKKEAHDLTHIAGKIIFHITDFTFYKFMIYILDSNQVNIGY